MHLLTLEEEALLTQVTEAHAKLPENGTQHYVAPAMVIQMESNLLTMGGRTELPHSGPLLKYKSMMID
jgi:hypothetical protein